MLLGRRVCVQSSVGALSTNWNCDGNVDIEQWPDFNLE